MSPHLLVVLLVAIPIVAIPVPEANPENVRLFADDPTYRASSAIEARFEGKLEFVPGQGGQPGRYRLIVTEGDGKVEPYPLHLPGAVTELAPLVGETVRIVGKPTEQGLWPGRLERVPRTGARPADGILARSTWQPASARKISRTLQTFVVRSGEQARLVLSLSNTDAATTLLARELRVPEIDWNRQMVVCVAAGLKTDVERIAITKTVARDGTLTVFYRMLKPGVAPGQGFGYPAETVLLPRFEGNLRFEEENSR